MLQMSAELEKFKEEIRSVLISAKKGLPINFNDISDDYYKFLAKNLPFHELGYRNMLELFQAIPDTVRLINHGEEVYLYSVSNDKTDPIDELVREQKNLKENVLSSTESSEVPPRFRRSSKLKTPVQREIFTEVPPKLKENLQKLLDKYPDGLPIQNIKSTYRQFFRTELNHQDFKFTRLIDFLRSLHDENVLNLIENSETSIIFSVKQNALNTSRTLPNEFRTSECELSNKDENTFINKRVLQNLKKIIGLFPKGFPLTQLCENYEKVSGSSLDLTDLGYNNVQEFISDLEDVFHVASNESGEWILLDARQQPVSKKSSRNLTSTENEKQEEVPYCVQKNIYDLLKCFSDGINLRQFEELYEVNYGTRTGWKELNYKNLESMLMSLKFKHLINFVRCGLNDTTVKFSSELTSSAPVSERLITPVCEDKVPKDVVVLGEVYTKLKVPDEDSDYFPVLVSTVDSPGSIWLQFVSQSEQRNASLDDLMNDLDDFYHSSIAEKYRIPEKYLTTSMNCAALYPEDQNWHRGCIIGQTGVNSYRVFYYDYGTICVVHKSVLRLLKKSFAILPAQAFPARMARMQPLSGCYSQESAVRLLELSAGKPLMAKITSKTYMNTDSVILCDTAEEEDIFLNDILVKEGLVQISNDHVQLRKPSEVASPDRNTYNHSYYSSPAEFEMPTDICDNPTAFKNVGQISPPQFSGFSEANLPHLVSLSNADGTQIQCSPSLTKLNQSLEYNNNILDPVILRRLEERVLARTNVNRLLNERSNAPQATVEPIQVSQAKDTECEETVPIRPVIQTNTNRPDEPVMIRDSDIFDNEETNLATDCESQEISRLSSSPACTETSPCTKQLRYCKKVSFRDDQLSAHLINFARQPCFNSGDVSSFIFGVDIIKRFLQIQKHPACHITVSRTDQPDLFDDLEMFEVTGFTKDDDKTDKVILYALPDVKKILSVLKQNKEMLVEDIEDLLQNFNPDDTYWFTNDNSVTVTYKDTLLSKLNYLKDERKSLLHTMLAEDFSSVQDTKHLLQIHEDILDLKTQLTEIKNHSNIKSATEQAREFLERVKIELETGTSSTSSPSIEESPECNPLVKTSECSPLENSTECTISPLDNSPESTYKAASLTSIPQTPMQTISESTCSKTNVTYSSPALLNNTNFISVGSAPVPFQGYANDITSNKVGSHLSVNVPAFYPPNLIFQPQNFQYPSSEGLNSLNFFGTYYGNYN